MRISDCSSDVCSSDLFNLLHSDFDPPVAERICTQGAVHAITETRACVRTLLHNQLPCQFRNRQKWVSGCSNFIGFARFAGRISNHCPNIGQRVRSEEHTSELQSLMRISYAVFCLKKKQKQHIT